MKCFLTQNINGLVRLWDGRPTYTAPGGIESSGWGRSNQNYREGRVHSIIGWPQFEAVAKECSLLKGATGIVEVELNIKVMGKVPTTPF